MSDGYQSYLIDGHFVRLKKCDKPDCFRLTTAIYCCGSCTYANEAGNKFELEKGREPPLGHTATCDDRHRQRQGLRPF